MSTETAATAATPAAEDEANTVRTSRRVDGIVLTKGIPLPPSKPRGSVYPFDKMEVGESFLIPVEDAKKKAVASNLAARISRWKDHNQQCKHWRFYTSASVAGGVRCWRIEDAPKGEENTPQQEMG